MTNFGGSSTFISFLHAFDRKRGHNMLTLMFDPRFKSMWLVTTFLGDENVVAIVVEYDKKNSYCIY